MDMAFVAAVIDPLMSKSHAVMIIVLSLLEIVFEADKVSVPSP